MNIKVRYTTDIPTIIQQPNGDWFDLAVAQDVCLTAGEYEEISFGAAIQLPEDCEAYVLPRSSTFKKYGILLANSMGLIDNSYCGNDDIWKFPAYATRNVYIPKGTRIAQFRVQKKMDAVTIVEVDDLGNPNRGGIGSTGN